MSSRKNRRSERFNAVHRVLVELTQPAVKEIVTTVEVSQHGAQVMARRTMPRDGRGSLQSLTSGRQVPCRIVWQKHETDKDGRMLTGLEIFTNSNFWGVSFSGPEFEEKAAPPPPPAASPAPVAQAPAPSLAEGIAAAAGMGEPQMLQLWSSLVELLEAKKVFTRDEFVDTLRRMSK